MIDEAFEPFDEARKDVAGAILLRRQKKTDNREKISPPPTPHRLYRAGMRVMMERAAMHALPASGKSPLGTKFASAAFQQQKNN